MAIKSDRWIRKMAQEHGMIEPFVDEQVRAGVVSYGLSSYGYDIRVADEFKVFTNINTTVIDPKNFDPRSFVDIKSDVCIVPPNSFALARTIEYFRIPRDVLTVCLGKSTYARCGIIVNVTPFEPSGRVSSRSRFPTPRRCPRRFTRTRVSRRCCSSRATKSANGRTPTRRAST
jgi:dCTP deaminase